MAISEKKRSGARFNLFDVILILVITAGIAGLVLHATFTKDLTETYSDTAKISISVSDISEQTAAAFCVSGAPIYLQETDEQIGTLDIGVYTPLMLEIENSEGALVKVKHPEKKSIRATAIFTGAWTDDGFLIGGTTLATIGKTLKIYTDNVVCEITVTGITKQE